jgi:hypothetical protein
MRTAQVVIFWLGVLAFVSSAFFIGQGMGDTLWRVGVAAMMTDFVCTRLWPAPRNT